MRREEAIKTLEENLCAMCAYGSQNMNSCDIRGCDNRDAIKALEQESILDKIRAELHATAEMHEDGDYYLRDEWIDEYFDKYKRESEVEE